MRHVRRAVDEVTDELEAVARPIECRSISNGGIDEAAPPTTPALDNVERLLASFFAPELDEALGSSWVARADRVAARPRSH